MVGGVQGWLPASEEEPMVEKNAPVLNKVLWRESDHFVHLSVPQPLSFRKAHVCLSKLLVGTQTSED